MSTLEAAWRAYHTDLSAKSQKSIRRFLWPMAIVIFALIFLWNSCGFVFLQWEDKHGLPRVGARYLQIFETCPEVDGGMALAEESSAAPWGRSHSAVTPDRRAPLIFHEQQLCWHRPQLLFHLATAVALAKSAHTSQREHMIMEHSFDHKQPALGKIYELSRLISFHSHNQPVFWVIIPIIRLYYI